MAKKYSINHIQPSTSHMIPQAEILFLVNPNAGKRNARKLLRKLEPYRPILDVQVIAKGGHSTEIIQSEFDNYQVFAVAGGDGTVNKVASALAGTDKKLAIFPSGSGNGFAREFGFDKNIRRLIKAIKQDNVLKADLIQLNECHMFHLSGIGFDSAVAHHFSQQKRRGFWSYFISAARTIWSFKPIEATIQLKNETITGSFFMINIANNRQFGYNAVIVPSANPTDGCFDLVLVPPFPRWMFPIFAFKLLTGILNPKKDIRVISGAKDVEIHTSETKIHIDGEPSIFRSPLKISIQPGVLSVIDTGKTKFKRKKPAVVHGRKYHPKQVQYFLGL